MRRAEFCTELRNFTEIRDFVESLLGQRGIGRRNQSEALLVFEALYNDMLAQGISEDTPVKVWGARHFGNVSVKISFEGSVYAPASGSKSSFDVENRLMLAYADRIGQRYHGGCNYLTITAKRSSVSVIRQNLIAFALAVLAYILIATLIDKSRHQDIINGLILMEKLFTDAIICVGAPVTFFSLLRNLTIMYVVREGNLGMRRLQTRAITSSVVSVALAVAAGLLLDGLLLFYYYILAHLLHGGTRIDLAVRVTASLSDIFASIVTPSIFEAFETFAPFPIIILAALTTYALCSSGNYFEDIKRVVDGCYVLFSKMLTAVMYTLPFFFLLSVLETLLRIGLLTIPIGPGIMLLVLPAMIVLALYYTVRLLAAGIKPGPFWKAMISLLKENLAINSAIDAVPFNIRYCARKYGIDRKRLEDYLPVLAQVNMDGNCFIITFIALLFMLMTSSVITLFDVIVIGLVILFLSLGAPNQPGSILIGLLMVFRYLQVDGMIALAIYSEALFGNLLSMTNVAGDIIEVAIADKRGNKGQKQNGSVLSEDRSLQTDTDCAACKKENTES